MLNEPYPSPKPTSRSLWISLVFGIFIGLFLIIFEPFEIDFSKESTTIVSLLFYGIITSAAVGIFLFALPLAFPSLFKDQRWKVKHQLLFWCTMLFVIATLNGIYTNYINKLSFSWNNYGLIIQQTFTLGAIPLSFLTIIDVYRRKIRNIQVAATIQKHNFAENLDSSDRILSINTDLKNETFELHESSFLYAAADGNYVDLYLLENDKIKGKTLRITLSAFEKQLSGKHFLRCHRSYLVNMNKVYQVDGNAQGLKLLFKNAIEFAPVSRNYIPSVKAFFSKKA
ncbi:MAG: LytTR family DNA-binding domain-containing protein [Bacteroidota bacterium]